MPNEKGAAGTAAGNYSFWVWNRSAPLTPEETAALGSGAIIRLYWQVGELEIAGGKFGLRRTASLPAATTGLQFIPVVRVSTAIRSPEQFSGEALGQALRLVADAAPHRELQLDFDCPDRLLPVYADRLRIARGIAGISRLTITALAGWADAPARNELWPAVDAVFPMLYDFAPDPPPVPGVPSPCQARPLLEPAVLHARLQSWSRCPIPWYAGLPAFARVTLFDATGHSQGHLRSWDWEDLVFNPTLVLDRPPANGTSVLRASRPTHVSENPVAAGGFAVVRNVELEALRQAIADADAAGARCIVLFRLPDAVSPQTSSGAGWSLLQILALLKNAAPDAGGPRLTLRKAVDGTERWILRNDSDADLPPRFADGQRGYGLELELAGGAAGWREALPGDFHRVAGHIFPAPGGSADASGRGNPGKPVMVPIPLAQRLTFWFAELPAHASLTTGLLQLAPRIDAAGIRFRLPADEQPENTPWQSPD